MPLPLLLAALIALVACGPPVEEQLLDRLAVVEERLELEQADGGERTASTPQDTRLRPATSQSSATDGGALPAGEGRPTH